MSIFVTGDIQRIAEYGACRFSSRSWPRGRELTRDDVAIVAGDFGFVWNDSNTDRYWLDWSESKTWTTCFVLGDDTDTTAAVAGALGGIVYGFDGRPSSWVDALKGKDVIGACLP